MVQYVLTERERERDLVLPVHTHNELAICYQLARAKQIALTRSWRRHSASFLTHSLQRASAIKLSKRPERSFSLAHSVDPDGLACPTVKQKRNRGPLCFSQYIKGLCVVGFFILMAPSTMANATGKTGSTISVSFPKVEICFVFFPQHDLCVLVVLVLATP